VRRVFVSLCLAMLMPVAACGDDSSGSDAASDDSPTPVTAADLAGRTFVSTTVTGFELIDGTEIRISFEEDHVSATAGCNTVGGAYTVENGLLSVSESSATLTACDPKLMTQDDQLIGFLTDDPAIALRGDILTLTGAEVSVEMRQDLGEQHGAPLVGTSWTLDSIVDGVSASSVPSGVEPPTLEISDMGEASVFTGCNRGGASVEVSDASLTFGPLRLTRMACGDDATAVEATVTSVIDGKVDYSINGDVLTVSKDAQALEYRAS
jgi:heat shock protein HslJ